MGTIMSEIANCYQIFCEDDMVSETKIFNSISEGKDLEERARLVNEIYKLLLESSMLNKVSILFIKTNMRYSNLAERFNVIYADDILKGQMKPKAESNIKVDISYCNKKLESAFGFEDSQGDKKNYFHELIINSNISDEVLKEARKTIVLLNEKYFKSNIDKSKILVNISNKEFNNLISSEDFDKFIECLKPYFVGQRKVAQQALNKQREAIGYYNYLMKTPVEDLSKLDKARLDQIKELMNPEIKKKEKSIYDKELKELQKDLLRHQERIERLDQQHLEFINSRRDSMSEIGKLFIDLIKSRKITLDNESIQKVGEHVNKINNFSKLIKENESSLSQQREQSDEIERKITERKERLQQKKEDKLRREIREQITDEQIQQRLNEIED